MRIAIIGAGKVGSTLGLRWACLGHQLTFGVTDPERSDHAKLRAAKVVTVEQSVAESEVVVLAVPWTAAADLVVSLGDLGSRIVIDCTNPVAFGPEGVFLLDIAAPSGFELLARAARGGRFVKTLNQVGFNVMADPGGAAMAVMFVAGDDPTARETASTLVSELGFEPRDAGPARNARALEALALLWIDQAARGPFGRDFVLSISPLAAS